MGETGRRQRNDKVPVPPVTFPPLLRPSQAGQERNKLSDRSGSTGKPRPSETSCERRPRPGCERARPERPDAFDLRRLLRRPRHRAGAGAGWRSPRLPGQLRLEPLHWAADTGHTSVVRQLVAAGANVNTRDSEGWSPLHWAAYRGHMEVVQELVGGGVDINITTKLDRNTKKQYTAWDLASMYGHSEVADFLRSQHFSP